MNIIKIFDKVMLFAFRGTLLIKGFNSVLESLSGVLILLVSKATVVALTERLVSVVFKHDPDNLFAAFLLRAANGISVSGQYFAGVYFIIHGLVKLVLVIGLLRRNPYAYPAAIVVFSLFVAYELYQYNITQAPLLLVLAGFDSLVVILTLYDYRAAKHRS